jgi:hypothetical protein
VPARAIAHLLEMAAERGHEPAFGLRLAESRRLSNLGPLGLLVRDEPTLRDALEAVMHHLHVHNEALTIAVEQHSNLVVVRLELTVEGKASLRQSIELAVGVTFRVLEIFMGASWQPALVCFTHPKPASLTVHRRLFGRAVEFGHQFNGIVCNAADLDVPNPGADAGDGALCPAPARAEPGHELAHERSRAPARGAAAAARACAASRWWRSTWASTGARWRVGWPKSRPRSARS